MFDRTYYATHPDMMECVSNEELRDRYLIQDLFRAGECVLNYTHADRFVIGGVAVASGSVTLPDQTEPAAAKGHPFLERRELAIGNGLADVEIPLVLGLNVKFQRHRPEHRRIDMVGGRQEPRLGREQRLESRGEAGAEILVLADLGKGQGAVPCAPFGIDDAAGGAVLAAVAVRHRHEALRDALADFLGRHALRPIRKRCGLALLCLHRRRNGRSRKCDDH